LADATTRRIIDRATSSDRITPAEDEMALAEKLPQADASSLVDRDVLEAQVQEM
jgi:hypothetical protein